MSASKLYGTWSAIITVNAVNKLHPQKLWILAFVYEVIFLFPPCGSLVLLFVVVTVYSHSSELLGMTRCFEQVG